MQILTYRRSQEPKVEGAAPQTVIGIGQDIIFREDGTHRRIVDLRLGRIYDVEGMRYVNSPMATEIVWRDSEMASRINLVKAMAAAGIDQDKLSLIREPFWSAIELKVTPANEAPPAINTRLEGGETIFLYNDAEVVRWRQTDKALPPQVAANLGRALRWFFQAHPQLIAKLAADGRAPQHAMVRWRAGNDLRTDDYQLVSSQWCATCQALPANAQPGLFVGGVFEKEMAPVMIAASQGKLNATSSEEYLRRVDAALERDAPLDAWLWFLERLLQDGTRKCQPGEAGDYCRIQNRLSMTAQSDANVRTLLQGTSKQTLESANAIAGLRNKAGSNAYYIDLASVNAIPQSALWFKSVDQEPLRSAERRMVSALVGMPMVPAVYRDIGNMYFAAVDVRRAWLAWEMGKANLGRSIETNLWRNADVAEALARQRHPEFF
jgi:hypothetical protein